jgi:hypothetical protein
MINDIWWFGGIIIVTSVQLIGIVVALNGILWHVKYDNM